MHLKCNENFASRVKRPLWQQQKFAKQIQQRKKSSNHEFQTYHGHLHTLMTSWHVISMEFVNGHFYHCVSSSDAGEKCVAGLSSLSASTWFHPIWRLPMTQVGEIPSSYKLFDHFRLVFYTVALFIYKYSVQCVRCTLLQAHLCFVTWNICFLPNHYFMVRNHNYQKVGISRIKNKHV